MADHTTIESDRCSTGKSNALLRQLEQRLEDRKRKKKHKRTARKRKSSTKRTKKKRRTRNAAPRPASPPSPRNAWPRKLDAADDYYARAAEFRDLAADAKDLYLDDLAAGPRGGSSRNLWTGNTPGASTRATAAARRPAAAKRTRHARSFKLSDTEARGLASARAAVRAPRRAQDDPTLIRQFDKQPAVVAKRRRRPPGEA